MLISQAFGEFQVFALISVLLNSPSSPKKQLVRILFLSPQPLPRIQLSETRRVVQVKSMKTVYLFQVTSSQSGSEETARWWVDMKVLSFSSSLFPSPLLPHSPPQGSIRVEERSSSTPQTIRESTLETRSDHLPIRQRLGRTRERDFEPNEIVGSEESTS